MEPAHRPLVAQPPEHIIADLAASTAPPERDPAKLSEFESEVIAIFVEMVHTLGLPKSYGEIYGLLYATADPLGFAEIHEKLDLSKGSVSGGLKALKEIGAVRLASAKDDRRERFEPELELRKLVLSYLKERIQPHIAAGAGRMEHLDGLLALEVTDPASRKSLNDRLYKLAKWRKKALGLLPWIARFFSS